jgi:Acyl-CoA dehydrogenase, C-terminal domain
MVMTTQTTQSTQSTQSMQTAQTNTMDADTRELLRTSLRHVLSDASSPAPLVDRLAELGWNDVVASHEADALGLLFGVKGDTLSSADALGPILARQLATATGDTSLRSAAVALPEVSGLEGDGSTMQCNAVFASTPVASAPLVVIVGDRCAIISDHSDLRTSTLHGVDPDLGLIGLSGRVASSEIRWVDGPTGTRLTATTQGLVATELIGIATHVIASAVSYTTQRVQYGKAIGTFQALQHRIATAHAQVIGATHLADEARRNNDPWTAMVAKAMAGQATENACVQAQQCYGAIGFTWEHEFHRYLKRAYALDWIAGDWRSLERRIGATLQATGVVPYIGAL